MHDSIQHLQDSYQMENNQKYEGIWWNVAITCKSYYS
jgi:hypothetical protein